MEKSRLEKLDLIRERTGATYSEADAALTKADGDVVKAIISLEKRVDKESVKEEFWVKGNELVDKVKELIKQGNITRIIVKSEEGKTLVEIPMTIGVLGTVIAPTVAVLGGLAALVTRCKIEIIRRENGEKQGASYNNTDDPNDEIMD